MTMMGDDGRRQTLGEAVERDDGRMPARPRAVDLDLLTELVYQRCLDELRRERERGGSA